jgi:NAD(P)-dependent dehydrogenase (short-subunit alcohol dehydrogenase family)
LQADVSVGAQVEALADAVEQTLGGATGLVNNAAIFRRTPFTAMTEADFDDHIAANLKGPYLMCRSFGAMFVRRGGGAIVNMADIHAIRPLANYVPYCVSKAGVIMLTEALALALAPMVRVNCICPGTILQPSQHQGVDDDVSAMLGKIPTRRLGTPEEIAAAVIFLLAGPAFVTGAVLPVDGAERLR